MGSRLSIRWQTVAKLAAGGIACVALVLVLPGLVRRPTPPPIEPEVGLATVATPGAHTAAALAPLAAPIGTAGDGLTPATGPAVTSATRLAVHAPERPIRVRIRALTCEEERPHAHHLHQDPGRDCRGGDGARVAHGGRARARRLLRGRDLQPGPSRLASRRRLLAHLGALRAGGGLRWRWRGAVGDHRRPADARR